MSTNDKTNSKVDTQHKDEAIAEVSATEADAVAGGAKAPPPIVIVSDPEGPMGKRPPNPIM